MHLENLTREQYSGVIPSRLNALSASRDTLNPMLNAENLKQRLATIEHYKFQHGIKFARWPHFFLGRVGANLYKYKFNYAVKGFAAYLLYRDIQNYRYWNEKVILSYQMDGMMAGEIATKAGLFVALCGFL